MDARTPARWAWAALLAPALAGCPMRGERAQDFFGHAVADAGDTNGDGVHELLVGAWNADDGTGSYGGRVYLYSGLSGVLLRTWYGESYGARLGFAVSGAGDLDGDGLDDVLMSAPRHDAGAAAPGGRVDAYSGRTGALLHRWAGNFDGLEFGFSAAGVGDYDGDGAPDVAVGQPLRNGPAGPESGGVFVYSGADGGLLATLSGGFAREHFGLRVAGAGDLDGDGRAEILASAAPASDDPPASPGSDAPGAGALSDPPPGRVYVYRGGGGFHGLAPGYASGDGFGVGLASLRDVDGDDVPDFAVGAPNYAATAGRVDLYSGATLLFIRSWDGGAAGDRLGWSVAGVGDLDRDGAGDLIVGAPGALFQGVQAGKALLLSGGTGATIWELGGAGFRDEFGHAVSGLSRASREGLDTVAIGAVGFDLPAENAGQVTVVTPFAFCGACAPSAGTPGSASALRIALGAAPYALIALVPPLLARRSRRRAAARSSAGG